MPSDDRKAPEGVRRDFLLAILSVETEFRPLHFRMAEYFAAYGSSLWGLLFKRQVRSWTIGPCQLALSIILAYHGYEAGFHDRKVRIPSLGAYFCLFSALSKEKSLRILGWRLKDKYEYALKKWPERPELQIRAVGEEYGGRLSYGLMAERAWKNRP